MNIFKLLFVLIALLLSLQFCYSQDTKLQVSNILSRYNQLSKIEDNNELNYQLSILKDSWLDLLTREDFEYPDAGDYALKQTKSEDGKFSVYYFIHSKSNEIHYVEMFISGKDSTGTKSFYFSEPLRLNNEAKNSFNKKDLQFNFFLRKIGSLDYYELNLTDVNNPIILYTYSDICLKFLFEQMTFSTELSQKENLNQIIETRLSNYITNSETFSNRLQTIKRISTLISEDKNLKIITWNIEKEPGINAYFGLVGVLQKDKSTKVFHLIDASENIRSPERSALSDKKWFGAIYFDIIETEYKKVKYYTLLGFKAADEFTKTKLMDVLTIESNGNIRFGSNIINKNPGYINRILFQYSASTNMMLKYDPEKKMIIMDSLSPSSPMYKNIYRFYGPDFSYNGYKFEKGKWMLYLDLDMRNPKQKSNR